MSLKNRVERLELKMAPNRPALSFHEFRQRPELIKEFMAMFYTDLGTPMRKKIDALITKARR